MKSGIGQRIEGFDLSGIEEDLGENAVCPDKEMVCCHENDKVKPVEEKICSNFEVHGYL